MQQKGLNPNAPSFVPKSRQQVPPPPPTQSQTQTPTSAEAPAPAPAPGSGIEEQKRGGPEHTAVGWPTAGVEDEEWPVDDDELMQMADEMFNANPIQEEEENQCAVSADYMMRCFTAAAEIKGPDSKNLVPLPSFSIALSILL